MKTTDSAAELLFATGNYRKINEANSTLAQYGITVKPVKIEIDEIQSTDPSNITKAKARAAFTLLGEPVVVSDSSWSIPALGGFPGGYMHDINEWWDEQHWIDIMANREDKTIILQEHIAYCDGEQVVHFSQDYHGVFLGHPQGPIVNENDSFERVASLDGVRSLAERQADVVANGETKKFEHWQKFGEWFISHDK